MPGGGAAPYPPSLKTSAQRALYNNLNQDEGLALAVDAVIMDSLQFYRKTSTMKTRKLSGLPSRRC